jgi:hypothetical protein
MPVTYLPLSHFTPIRWSDRDVPLVVRSQPGPKYRSRARFALLGFRPVAHQKSASS